MIHVHLGRGMLNVLKKNRRTVQIIISKRVLLLQLFRNEIGIFIKHRARQEAS